MILDPVMRSGIERLGKRHAKQCCKYFEAACQSEGPTVRIGSDYQSQWWLLHWWCWLRQEGA